MKLLSKIFSIFCLLACFAACEDIPMPYEINEEGEDNDSSIYYSSASLYNGWTLMRIGDNQPWSQGSSYTQATGYQKWDGADTKSNRAAEGLLVSPAFNTKALKTGKVKISFDNCVGYANNDAAYADHIKLLIAKTPDTGTYIAEDWKELDWKATHVSTDWTLTKDEVQIPEEYVNKEDIRIAFWFVTGSADKSVTFELKNFVIEEGVAQKDDVTPNPPTPTVTSTKENPLTVAQAMTATGNQYVKGYIVGYVEGKTISEGATFAAASNATTNLLLADKADEKDANNCIPVQLPAGKLRDALNLSVSGILGKQVEIYGSLEKYFGVPGLKNPEWAKLDNKEIGDDPDFVSTGIVWDFTKSQCNFTIENKTMPEALSYIWQQSAQYGMKASAYVNNTDYACEGWLISPTTDLTGKSTMTISHAGKFFASADQMKKDITIWACQNDGEWKQLTISTYPSNNDWNFVDATIDLGEFTNKSNVKIAFVYKSEKKSGTWEVKKATIY